MVIKRSLFGNLEHIARGIIVNVDEESFEIKFPKKMGKERFQSFKMNKNYIHQIPTRNTNVLCRYSNSKKEKITEIYNLNGKWIYKEDN